MKFVISLTVLLCGVIAGIGATTPPAEAAGNARHVVIVVWDGMRPDFVDEQHTPALWKLASRGVIFTRHHAVYPSATNVNGTAMATGVYPGHSGIIANHEFRPEINDHTAVDTTDASTVGKGDGLSGNKYLAVPTIATLVRQSGGRTIVAASKTIGLLLDREVATNVTQNSVTLFAGDVLPHEALARITAALGPFPKHHLEQDAWTTKTLDLFWKENLPALSVLWLGEPDLTQHETAPGDPAALAAIKSSDQNLAQVLADLDRLHATENTDIFVVSDHGFSTIERTVDLRKILTDAGFDAITQSSAAPKRGQIMMAGNGGTVLFYVIGHDAALIRRLVEFLQQSDFAGVIFTRQKMEGTFGFDAANVDSAQAPDVEMAFRWTDRKSANGVAGMIDADWQREAGKGTHATLSRFDMHNILFATGPDFRTGYRDDLPSGNIDLAPTVLQILGIDRPPAIDGRVLNEAMVGSHGETPTPQTDTLEASKRFSSGTWRQTLKITRVGSTIYLDEGNGDFRP